LIIPAHYINVYDFYEGLAAVQTEKQKWGFIDQTGRFVVEPIYDECNYFFSNGYACVKANMMKDDSGKWTGQYGLVDKNGKLVIPLICDSIDLSGPHQGLIAFSTEGEPYEGIFFRSKWGFADLDGKVVIKPIFSYASNFDEYGLALVKTGGYFDEDNNYLEEKWGVINQKGEFVIEPQFQGISIVSGNIIAVRVEGKYGFVNRQGKMFVAPKFSTVSSLREGLIAVKVGGLSKIEVFMAVNGGLLIPRERDGYRP
jgi:hypothetical protein